jgi:hypothetical protein
LICSAVCSWPRRGRRHLLCSPARRPPPPHTHSPSPVITLARSPGRAASPAHCCAFAFSVQGSCRPALITPLLTAHDRPTSAATSPLEPRRQRPLFFFATAAERRIRVVASCRQQIFFLRANAGTRWCVPMTHGNECTPADCSGGNVRATPSEYSPQGSRSPVGVLCQQLLTACRRRVHRATVIHDTASS